MRICDEHKLIFVSTPKSGSHTGWKVMDDNFKISQRGMHNNIVPVNCINYKAFTFVRNPYERAISLWNSLLWAHTSGVGDPKINMRYRKIFMEKIGSDTFEDFCLWLNTDKKIKDFYSVFSETQVEYWKKTNLMDITYIKLENINEELPKFIFDNTGKIINFIPHELKRKHEKWDKLYTEKNKLNIIKWAKEDFVQYNYIS